MRIQPHIFCISVKSRDEKGRGAGVGGKKRKRAFLGSPQVEIASGCALGGRRGLARPAIEPPLPMPQAINRHKGCLSDESCSCFSSSVHRLHVVDFRQLRYRNICKPASQGALTPHKQDGSGQSAATNFLKKSATSQPGHCQCLPGLSVIEFRDFPKIGVLKSQIKRL